MIIKVNGDITLKQVEQSDTHSIFHTINTQRKYLGKWLRFVELTKDISDTQRFVTAVINTPENKLEFTFTIRKNHEFVGLIGLTGTDIQNRKTEIGYWLSEKFQKQGIVTKSVKALCSFAFDTLNLNRVQIKCAVQNHPSRNIPQKLGFKLEGIERDGELLTGNAFTDMEIYSLLKSDT